MLASFALALDNKEQPAWVMPFLTAIRRFMASWSKDLIEETALYKALLKYFSTSKKNIVAMTASQTALQFIETRLQLGRLDKRLTNMEAKQARDSTRIDTLESKVGQLMTARAQFSKTYVNHN